MTMTMNNEDRVRVWDEVKSVLPPHYQQEITDMLDAAEARERKKCTVLIRELRAALADFLGGESSYACKFLHHAKRERHFWSEQCPVTTRYRALLVNNAKAKESD